MEEKKDLLHNDIQIRLKDIAREANVSISTVSRYLNGIKVKATAEKKLKAVLENIKWSQYSTSRLEAEISEESNVIAMVVPDIGNNYFATIVSGVAKIINEKNLVLLLASAERSKKKEQDVLIQLLKIKLMGLIYVPVASWSGDLPKEILAFSKIPMVIIGRRNIIFGKPHVYTDNIHGGYLATRYLLSLGRRNIGFIVGVWEYPFESYDIKEIIADDSKSGGFASFDRFKGYLKALEEYELPYNPELVTVSSWSFEGGKVAAAELLGKVPLLDAVIATSDAMASGVLDTFKSHGFVVPDDISIMGWDNSELARFTDPQLTSVDQPSYKMGMSAVNMILKMNKNGEASDVIYEASIVPRRSTSIKK